MLDWLFRRRRSWRTRIWRNEGCARDAMVAYVGEQLRGGSRVLIAAQFDETFDVWRTALNEAGVSIELVQSTNESELLGQPDSHFACKGIVASELLNRREFSRARPLGGPSMVVVAERHLSAREDDRLENFLRSLRCTPEFISFVSLDMPLMRLFNSQQIEALMDRWGMAPDEELCHSALDNSVRAAQRRIDREVHAPGTPAPSAEAWLRRNLPGGKV